MDSLNNKPTEEDKFFHVMNGLIELIHELVCICHDDGYKIIPPELLIIGKTYLQEYNRTNLINNFIQYSYKYWSQIKNRDEIFFIEHANDIFKDFGFQKEINLFSALFTTKNSQGQYIILSDDKDAIWEFFESLIKISIKYIHRIRGLKMIQTPKGLLPRYQHNTFPEISIRKTAKIWGIELDGFPKN